MNENYVLAATKYRELSNDVRIDILFTLFKKKTKISEIANSYKISIQESMRNFNRLSDAGLISKNSENYFNLTPIGQIACNHIPAFVFMSNSSDYFRLHDFGDLPNQFIQRLGSFLNCKRITGLTKILDKWMSMYNNATKNIYLISSDIFESSFPSLVIDKLNGGIEFNYIVDKSVIIDEKQNLKAKKIFRRFLLDGVVKRRIIEHIQITLILNDQEGFVMFPTIDGNTDMREGFYGTEPEFLEWCHDYYDNCWKKSNGIKKLELPSN